ncbi:MAG: PLP-dependent transferase [Bryobacteraceae bacterium]
MSDHEGSSHVRPPTALLTRGFDPSLSVGSARPAVFRSSTYVFSSPEAAERAFDITAGRAQPEPGEAVDLIYSRFNHPNAEILEEQILALEPGAKASAVFNSGMAAIMTAILTVARPGDSIVFTMPLYGGTHHLIHDFLEPFGIRGIGVLAGQSAALDEAIRTAENLRIVLIETPANPTLVMTDIRRAVATAAARATDGTPAPLVMVDNTFLGPTFQHPIPLGADLVLYSATKYLAGFSDMIGGVALAADPNLIRQIRGKRGLFGNILQPDECWMLGGRLPTVTLRMNKQSKNAQRIAERLHGHPKIRKVYYPTLFDNPDQVAIFESQCEYPGAVLSIELKGGRKAAFEFLRNIRIGHNAVSLGGVETLVCHPKTTTHSGFSEEQCQAEGITDGFVRISIGIEHWRDLLEDFERALEAV